MSATQDNTLLVPMGMKALVITSDADGSLWDRQQMQYSNLNQFQSPVPPLFSAGDSPGEAGGPPEGVTLYWSLPVGLTTVPHAKTDVQGSTTSGLTGTDGTAGANTVNLPLAPNRWLIVRIAQPENTTEAPDVAAWMVVSDQIDNRHGTSSFVDPFHTPSGYGNMVSPTKIGVQMALDAWSAQQGEAGVTPPAAGFLTAAGPGDVTFGAYSPGTGNVFSFTDGLSGLSTANLSYAVIGWYANENDDPINPAVASGTPAKTITWTPVTDPELASSVGLDAADNVVIEDRLGWMVELGDAATPTYSCLHAMIHSITWDASASQVPPPGYVETGDVPSKVKVAVGNTSVDALAAISLEAAGDAKEGRRIALLLEALQYGALRYLDEPGGIEALRHRIKRGAYGAEYGGLRWELVADPAATQGTGGFSLTSDQKTWLAGINQQQAEFDASLEILGSMQWRLYGLWWDTQTAPFASSQNHQSELSAAQDLLQDPATLSDYSDQVSAQIAQVQSLATGLPPVQDGGEDAALAQYLEDALGTTGAVLRPVLEPRYWKPSDPVLMVAGAGNLKQVQPRVIRCRLVSQTIDTLSIAGSTAVTLNDLAGVLPSLPSDALSYISPASTALLNEDFLLNPDNAAAIAGAVLTDPSTQTISALETQISEFQDMQVLAPMAYAAAPWVQPWVPLYLDWSVAFYYTYKTGKTGGYSLNNAGQYEFDQADWSFDGDDYVWQPNTVQTDQSTIYSGRTFVTPHASRTLASRLETYANQLPDAGLDGDQIDALKDWEVFSQTLGGLTDLFAMRDMGTNVPPDDSIASLVNPNAKGVPYPQVYPDADTSFGQTGYPYFFPLRGGFLGFKGLRLTDSYGRVLDLSHANGGTVGADTTLRPITPPELTASQYTPSNSNVPSDSLVNLAPRLVQPSRLAMRFVSGTDDGQELGLSSDVNPICGWLLPNHLDQSLSVYDASGTLLGELTTFLYAADQRTVEWMPAPGGSSSPASTGGTPAIDNANLNALVNSVMGLSDNGAAFLALLQTIDETNWTIDPLGGRDDGGMSVLMGYPIAVTRANLQLQLKGLPYANQAYEALPNSTGDALQFDPGDLLDLSFDVRLGAGLHNDGVLGYYEGNEYSTFNAVHRPKDCDTDYIAQIGGTNYISLSPVPSTSTPSAGADFDTTGSEYITMLVDPRGAIHASTGLLPVRKIELPSDLVDDALAQMSITFQTGPVLVDSQTVALPMPSEQSGVWSWVQATGTGPGDWQEDALVRATDRATLFGPSPILREGWLKFSHRDGSS